MGEAKRRKQAQAAGKPWPPRDASAPVAKPQSAQAFLDQLPPEMRAEFFRLFETTRDATRQALSGLRDLPEMERAQRLEAVARARHADLESTTNAAFDGSEDGRAMRAAVACRKGCSFCCHINVSVTIPEAILVAASLRHGPYREFAPRVEATAARAAGLNELERFRHALPCPMLKDGACGIYDVRPTACRAYLATDAKQCEASLESARTVGTPTPVESLAYPQQISAAINGGVLQACADAGLQNCAVELSQATALMLRDDTAVTRWLNGEAVFEPYRRA